MTEKKVIDSQARRFEYKQKFPAHAGDMKDIHIEDERNMESAYRMAISKFGYKLEKHPLDPRPFYLFPPPDNVSNLEWAVSAIDKNKAPYLGGIKAGFRHFNKPWNMDIAKSINGIVDMVHGLDDNGKVLHTQKVSLDDLTAEVRTLVDLSLQTPLKHVYTGIAQHRKTQEIYGMDIPHERVDNLPALIYKISILQKEGRNMFQEIPNLQDALNTFVASYIRDFTYGKEGEYFVNMENAGDWVDTVRRPSSGWALIWQLQMLKDLDKWEELGIHIERPEDFTFKNFKKTVLQYGFEEKSNGEGYLVDYQGKDILSVDANVLALYLGVFDKSYLEKIAHTMMGNEKLFDPYPMRMADIPYHLHGDFQEAGIPQNLERNILKNPGLAIRNNFFVSLLRRQNKDFDPERSGAITTIAENYHSVIWPHMGNMFVTGLLKLAQQEEDSSKRLDLIIKAQEYKEGIDRAIRRFGFIETIDPEKSMKDSKTGEILPGAPFQTVGLRTEAVLTMNAATYIELCAVLDSIKKKELIASDENN